LRARSDRASGVISTTMGVAVFLSLLLLAAHVLLNLWVTSTVDAAARDAATRVALSDDADATSVRQAAIERARGQLGAIGSQTTFEFDDTPRDDSVVLRVHAPGIGLVPALGRLIPSLSSVDTRVVVRKERT
jgi:hypothetical protein